MQFENVWSKMTTMKNFADLKVFIVDDDPFCRMMYHQHLLNLGYKNLELFSNGPDCVNHLSENPDVILIDYDMKPCNGLETLKIVKQYNPDIYILMLSAQKDIRVAINALKHGAFDYISKGGNDGELISKVMKNISASISKEMQAVLV